MSATQRLAVRKRAGTRCEYCLLPDLAPSIGRTTVWFLEFNSDERLKLREGLWRIGSS